MVAGLFFQEEVRDRMARILDFFLKYLTGGWHYIIGIWALCNALYAIMIVR